MKRGPYGDGRKQLLNKAIELRNHGYGYRTISKMIGGGVPYNTVKNWVSGIKVSKEIAYKKSCEIRRGSIQEIGSLKKGGVRSVLLREFGNICMSCGLSDWMGKQIMIEVHHIDGNNKNNMLSNLQLLCPNCHSNTDNYRNKKRI